MDAASTHPLPDSPATSVPKFYRMVEAPDWSGVLNAVQSGIDLNDLRTRTGLSALAAAVIDDAPMMVEHLLAAGASPRSFRLFSGTFFSPLWAAITREQEGIARRLLDAGADPNEEVDGQFPVLYAAQAGQTLTTRALCHAGVNPDPDPRQSALHLWVPKLVEEHPQRGLRFGSPDPILALLDAGADADARDVRNRSVPEAARAAWRPFLGGALTVLSAEATLVALERSLLRRTVRDIEGEPRAHRRL